MGKKAVFGSALIAFSAYLAFKYFDTADTPVVRISSGDLVGFVSRSREGREFFQFLGIPYGKAERFEPPHPADKWEGVRKAKKYGNMCMHVNSITQMIEGEENCLHLNVFCPKFKESPTENGKKLLPVFVYVHGGYFMAGGSNYMGPLYLMQEDVVLVTINYRLASLGFLNTGDGVVRGNMGMKDQVLALRFVQKEIAKFGGDPSNVILWGESAGAAAVHFHLLSPMSKGLFKKAIMASGTAIKPWSLVTKPKEQAVLFAKSVNCPTDNSSVMVECLKQVDGKILINAHMDALDSPIMNPLKVFAPSVEISDKDDTFLSEHPYDILKEGRAHRVPLLTGVNSHEGLLATARMYHNRTLAGVVERSWDDLSPTFFSYQQSLSNVSKKIREFYFGKSKKLSFFDMFLNFTNVFSDRWYIHATRETVKTQVKYSTVYLYHFSYALERGLTFFYDLTPTIPVTLQISWKVVREWVDKHVLGKPPLYLGTCHGDELVLFFHFPMVYIDVGHKDYVISRQFIKMWMQFANDEPITIENSEWSPLPNNTTQLKYMHFGNEPSTFATQIEEPFADRMLFWDSLNLPWKIDV